ncbi:MAG: hypothetical protein WBM36_04605, partial [Lysobacterales bacterium]
MSEDLAFYFARGVIATAVLILSVTAHFVAKRYVLSSISYVVLKSKLKWDDAILHQGALNRLTYLVPAIVIFVLTPFALEGMETTIDVIRGATQIYMLIILMLVVDSLLNSVEEIYRSFQASKEVPIKGFIQISKIVLYFLTAVFVISILLNKTPLFLLSGIGAL